MSFLKKLLTVAALVAVGFAASVSHVDKPRCSGKTLESSTTIHAGGHDVLFTTHSCNPSSVGRRQSPTDVCGAPCDISCNNVTGILPPISQDCQTIDNAVVILQGTMSPNFVVEPNHLVTLTFGTCSYFFENLGSYEVESCWSGLSSLGDATAAACFPPNQPFFPEGVCTAVDGTWAAGASHS